MDLLTIALAIFFVVMSYVMFDTYMNKVDGTEDTSRAFYSSAPTTSTPQMHSAPPSGARNNDAVADESAKEVIYTQDYYPWWRSTRWWNYDGWLYQKPYYNYWRRPYYYNYWYAGRPLVIGGKRLYKRRFQ